MIVTALCVKTHFLLLKVYLADIGGRFTIEGGQLTYVRALHLAKGTFDKSLFPEFRGFLRKLARADKAKIVCKKDAELADQSE